MGNLTTQQKLIILAVAWLLLSRGGGVGPLSKPDFVTYVHAARTDVPSEVRVALDKLNMREGITASDYPVTAGEPTPEQYKIAAGASSDPPFLVVQAKAKVLKVVQDPKTEKQVLEAVP